MLFVIVAEHTAEDCPGGKVRPDKQFFAKVGESMKKSGVKLVEGYLDAAGHVFFLVVDASDNMSLSEAVEPFRYVGTVRYYPVMKFSEAFTWAKKGGIME